MANLSLKHFILQHRVLNLYRYAIRASRGISDVSARKETIRWIRAEFERNRHIEDAAAIQDKLASGHREIKQFFPAAPLRPPR
ncbi:hypothetical protein OF83DRAFT_1050752 [Amylostereum chailletii]|nr:hypothetical protein OF83DRAFT_1050752 [Amylostereum chailletii]